MCSILGMGFLKERKIDDLAMIKGMLSVLFKSAQSGGRTATGASFMHERESYVVKGHMSASEMIASDKWLETIDKQIHFNHGTKEGALLSIVGHCRFPTKGSPLNNKNNHPIVTGDVIGVHNGCISNDDALFVEKGYGLKRIAEVDSEIIFSLIDKFSENIADPVIPAIQRATKLLVGSYACAIHHNRNPYNFYIFRNYMPVCVRAYECGLVMFATRKNYIEDAEKIGADLGNYEEYILDENEGISINVHTKRFHIFDCDKTAVRTALMY